MLARQRRFLSTPEQDPYGDIRAAYPDALIYDFAAAEKKTGGRPYFLKDQKRALHPRELGGWSYTGGQLMKRRADGLWVLRGANDDTVMPGDGGLDVLEARQNIVTYSQDQASNWGLSNVTREVSKPSPDGLNNARDYLNTPGATSYTGAGSAVSMTVSTTYTRAVIAKSVYGTGVIALEASSNGTVSRAVFNLISGTIQSSPSTLNGTASITPLSDGWFLCVFTFTTAASGAHSAGNIHIGGYGSSGTQSSIRVWQADLQAGAYYAGSILTNGASVSRGNIAATISTAALTYPRLIGLRIQQPAIDGVARQYLQTGATSADRLNINRGASNVLNIGVIASGVSSTTRSFGSKTGDRQIDVAVLLHADGFTVGCDGALTAKIAATMPAINNHLLGRSTGGSYGNCGIMRLVDIPNIQPADELALLQRFSQAA